MPSRRRALTLAGLALVATSAWLLASAARAGVADPARSFVSGRVVVCPAGDSMLVVIARHADGVVWWEDPIWAEVCGCPGFRASSVRPDCSYPDTSLCNFTMFPDPLGVVEIPISGGGLCPGGSIRVFAGGVLLATLPEPACFDQNGDLVVDSTDVAIVRSKIGSSDPGADFDGDGTVTEADVAILMQHLGHASPDAAPPAALQRERRAPR